MTHGKWLALNDFSMTKLKKILIWTFGIIIALGFTCLAVVMGCEIAVNCASKGRVYDDVEEIPHREVGLLLGTNPKGRYGGPNRFYIHRIDAAVTLYEAGKVDRFIISGAKTGPDYDEPEAMRQSLVSRGVPDSILVLDGEGLHTNASIKRAKEMFGVDSLTIVSQEFHNRRSLYMAKHYGIDAIAYNASNTVNRKWRLVMFLRERGSRVKAVFEVNCSN